jgi:hypothetical protein
MWGAPTARSAATARREVAGGTIESFAPCMISVGSDLYGSAAPSAMPPAPEIGGESGPDVVGLAAEVVRASTTHGVPHEIRCDRCRWRSAPGSISVGPSCRFPPTPSWSSRRHRRASRPPWRPGVPVRLPHQLGGGRHDVPAGARGRGVARDQSGGRRAMVAVERDPADGPERLPGAAPAGPGARRLSRRRRRPHLNGSGGSYFANIAR